MKAVDHNMNRGEGLSLPVVKRTGEIYAKGLPERFRPDEKPSVSRSVMEGKVQEKKQIMDESEVQRILAMARSYPEKEIPLHFRVEKGRMMDVFA